ncbi:MULTISPECIES: Ig-like domain-containing protein [unclassified Rathayibacter]|uniref:Ig-like domain-containing protein n=1 Tax=unclassified Rathayibacter TaxID=2609250 RepID=UPI00188B2A63|nr:MULTISPECIES: Ig-like domain-containing protein [unclassified Rathayibacter]MBF4461239.1 hypothetical protein [Rathayibacter sp. VKM Ac-2879]MBF4502650.1 hypothetical protein [Rathayibacter sp. VKM Ac-2878]
MSTDVRPSATRASVPSDPPADRALRRYRVVLASTLAALVLLVGGLTAATALQGPRVTGVQVSTVGVVERDGARLRLRLDRAVDPSVIDRVSVSPSVPTTVTVAGSEITVAFNALLRYGTDYTVSVTGVSAPGGPASDVSTRFTTSSIDVLSLERGSNGSSDRITSRPLAGGDSRTEFEAGRIVAYATTLPTLAVVTEDSGGRQTLQTVDRASGVVTPVALPEGATVSELRGSTSAPRVGFTFSTPDAPDRHTLDTLDISGAGATPVSANGPDGQALSVASWAFEPGSTSVAALTDAGELYRVDAGATAPTSLGEHEKLRGFVPGTSDLVVADAEAGSVVDLRTGEEASLEVPPDVAASGSSTPAVLLDGSSYLRTVSERSGAFGTTEGIVLFDGYADRLLYQPSAGSSIASTCISPNGQYLAVHLRDSGADSTDLVDSRSGAVAARLPGTSLDWC